MAYTLRTATIEDDAAIKQIIRVAGINPLGLDWHRFIVAEDSGQIIGTGQIKPHKDKTGGWRELASIAVIPSRQRQGIARAIINKLLENETGLLHLICASHNGSSYLQFGFRRSTRQEMPRYFQRLTSVFATVTGIAKVFMSKQQREKMETLVVMHRLPIQ